MTHQRYIKVRHIQSMSSKIRGKVEEYKEQLPTPFYEKVKFFLSEIDRTVHLLRCDVSGMNDNEPYERGNEYCEVKP